MIDAFCHILPPKYEETRWARAGSKDFAANSPAHLQYVRTGKKAPNYEGLTNLDARFRMMDEFEDYRQVICLASPSPEHIAPNASVELSTIANDELAGLVAKYPDRFAGAAGAVPMNEPDAACREIERAFTPAAAVRGPDLHQRERPSARLAGVPAGLEDAGRSRRARPAASRPQQQTP